MKTRSLMKDIIGCHELLKLVRQIVTSIVTMRNTKERDDVEVMVDFTSDLKV